MTFEVGDLVYVEPSWVYVLDNIHQFHQHLMKRPSVFEVKLPMLGVVLESKQNKDRTRRDYSLIATCNDELLVVNTDYLRYVK